MVAQLGEHSLLAADAPQRRRQARHALPGRGPGGTEGVTHCAHTTPSKNMQADVRVCVGAGGEMTPGQCPRPGAPHPLHIIRRHRGQAGGLHRRQLPQPAEVLELRLKSALRQRSCSHAHVISTSTFGEDENIPRAA